MEVKDYMSSDVISVEEYNIVEDVLIIMYKYRRLNLPVIDFAERLIGTINACDILSLVTTENYSLYESALNTLEVPSDFLFEDLQKVKNKYIVEFLNPNVTFAYGDDTISHIANILLEQRLVSIPVVNRNKKLIGILDSIEMLYKMLNYDEA